MPNPDGASPTPPVPVATPQPLGVYNPATDLVSARPPLHILGYGDYGAKKSTFFATLPKPLLVLFFDPFGKDGPYLRAGTPQPLLVDSFGTPIRRVLGPDGSLLVQIEHFNDVDPTQPEAWSRFGKRLNQFLYYKEWHQWASLVADSLTFMEMAARKQDEYGTNKGAKDKRQHSAASARCLEEVISGSFGSLPINVGLAAHIDEKQDQVHGNMIYNPAAPGQQSKRIPAGFSEVYRFFVRTEPTGENVHLMQTQKDNMYSACTQIPAPNPCYPHYESLWQPQVQS